MHKTVPIEVSLRTPWGAVKMPPTTFAVMPGSDNVVLFGMATMEELGIDLYPLALERLRPRSVPVQQGVEGPSFLAVFMDPAEERVEREQALEDSVEEAVHDGLSADGSGRLRDILGCRVNAFRRALRGDPPARGEPMRVQLKPQAQAVKAKPRRSNPVKTGWLASCIAALVAFGLLVHNIQAEWASPAMAVPKRDTFRLVSDYQAVNSLVEQPPGVMPDHEDMKDLLGAKYFGKLDLLQGYWQMPLAPEAPEIFTIATPGGCSPPLVF
ncbi:unnamed protein product, partial [Scytosiphon promiscuus]